MNGSRFLTGVLHAQSSGMFTPLPASSEDHMHPSLLSCAPISSGKQGSGFSFTDGDTETQKGCMTSQTCRLQDQSRVLVPAPFLYSHLTSPVNKANADYKVRGLRGDQESAWGSSSRCLQRSCLCLASEGQPCTVNRSESSLGAGRSI